MRSVAALLALAAALHGAVPAALPVPEDRTVVPRNEVWVVSDGTHRPPIEAASDPFVIREAHSDGGYSYWLERQPVAAGERDP
jgi:hypothetical protein